MNYYVTSFISIVHFISDDLIQCDATTRIVELFGDEFDDLDFELALCCFESTHKVAPSMQLMSGTVAAPLLLVQPASARHKTKLRILSPK